MKLFIHKSLNQEKNIVVFFFRSDFGFLDSGQKMSESRSDSHNFCTRVHIRTKLGKHSFLNQKRLISGSEDGGQMISRSSVTEKQCEPNFERFFLNPSNAGHIS